MATTARFTQTAATGYRYNVQRNGVVHCRSNDLKLLCADCQRTASTCTCDTCRGERGHRAPSPTPAAPRTATAPPAAPRPPAPEPLPAAPKVSAAILAARRIEPAQVGQLVDAPNGIPTISLSARVKANRAARSGR